MKLTEAIEYLRSRGKYIADQNCKWTPTNAAKTNVKKTIEEYRKWLKKSPASTVSDGALTVKAAAPYSVVFMSKAKMA
ncbi:MAG TPA: hypothetical protein DEP47_05480 [Chloroflexi bacterium]|nr:hypothetical protein [Chloroflexota bacterium]